MDASFHIQPFAFDRIFSIGPVPHGDMDASDLQLRLAALTAEAERVREDHAVLLVLARAEAFEAGLAQAREERQAALLSAVDALHATIEAADGRLDTTIRQVTEDAAEAALAGAELLAARALELAPCAAVDAAIGRALKQVARGQELEIRVHPGLVEEVERLVAERQAGDRRRLQLHVVGDETLAPGDARIGWEQGGLTLDAAARSARLRAELASLLPIA